MQLNAVRLELLRLVHRFDRPPEDVINAAKAYEQYVFDTPAAPAETPEAGGDNAVNPLS